MGSPFKCCFKFNLRRYIEENETLKMARIKLVISKMFTSQLTGAWRRGRVTPLIHP